MWTGHVTATEVALSRSLALAFSGRKAKIPPLPTWAEVSGENRAKKPRKSDFKERFERVNVKRQDSQKEPLDDALEYGDDPSQDTG